jgi:succinate-semialdehyde dehydrogenase/glutarate-semialdehyde dehydrogenase
MDMKTSPLATLADATLLKTDALINGEWVGSAGRFAVTDPATGLELAQVANLGAAEAEAATAAADRAWPAWRAKTAKERGAILMAWFRLLHQHADDLARIMTAEQGKPLAEAKGEVGYGASFLEWFAEEGKRVYGETIPTTDGNKRYLVLKQPMGVCAAITPWNFPIAMITRKVAPALAAGCPVIIKPAEQTPLSALAVAELAQRAGMPPGVLNVLTADGANSIAIGKVLCASDTVRHLSFTGSTEVGRILAAQCAPTVKKLSLELGGNAPFIVFDDADLDSAVEGAMISKYRNAGQTCVCANRLYVQDGVYDAFVAKLAAKVKDIKVGNGFEAGVNQGPLIDDAAIAKVESHVADALAKGATLLTGGRKLGDRFYEPTVLANASGAMLLRPGGPGVPLPDRGRGHRVRQRHRVRPGELLLQPRRRPHLPRRRGARVRHGRHQHRADLDRRGALRRRQAVRPGARGLAPRHRRLRGAEVPLPGGHPALKFGP